MHGKNPLPPERSEKEKKKKVRTENGGFIAASSVEVEPKEQINYGDVNWLLGAFEEECLSSTIWLSFDFVNNPNHFEFDQNLCSCISCIKIGKDSAAIFKKAEKPRKSNTRRGKRDGHKADGSEPTMTDEMIFAKITGREDLLVGKPDDGHNTSSGAHHNTIERISRGSLIASKIVYKLAEATGATKKKTTAGDGEDLVHKFGYTISRSEIQEANENIMKKLSSTGPARIIADIGFRELTPSEDNGNGNSERAFHVINRRHRIPLKDEVEDMKKGQYSFDRQPMSAFREDKLRQGQEIKRGFAATSAAAFVSDDRNAAAVDAIRRAMKGTTTCPYTISSEPLSPGFLQATAPMDPWVPAHHRADTSHLLFDDLRRSADSDKNLDKIFARRGKMASAGGHHPPPHLSVSSSMGALRLPGSQLLSDEPRPNSAGAALTVGFEAEFNQRALEARYASLDEQRQRLLSAGSSGSDSPRGGLGMDSSEEEISPELDPLYRIMTEECEEAVDRATARLMLRVPEIKSLAQFSKPTPEMWVTARVAYVLIFVYHDLMIRGGFEWMEPADRAALRARLSVKTFVESKSLPRPRRQPQQNQSDKTNGLSEREPSESCQSLQGGGVRIVRWDEGDAPVTAVGLSDSEYAKSISVRCDFNKVWKVLEEQRVSEGIKDAHAALRLFSWPLLQQLMSPSLQTEFSALLDRIEIDRQIGEFEDDEIVKQDDDMNLFFVVFPRPLLAVLRASVQRNVFHPTHLQHTSSTAARMCSWGRRVLTGIYKSKALETRLRLPPSALLVPSKKSSAFSLAALPAPLPSMRRVLPPLRTGAVSFAPFQSSPRNPIAVVAEANNEEEEGTVSPSTPRAVAGFGNLSASQLTGYSATGRPTEPSGLLAAITVFSFCFNVFPVNSSLSLRKADLCTHVLEQLVASSLALVRPFDRLDFLLSPADSTQVLNSTADYCRQAINLVSNSPIHRVLTTTASRRVDSAGVQPQREASKLGGGRQDTNESVIGAGFTPAVSFAELSAAGKSANSKIDPINSRLTMHTLDMFTALDVLLYCTDRATPISTPTIPACDMVFLGVPSLPPGAPRGRPNLAKREARNAERRSEFKKLLSVTQSLKQSLALVLAGVGVGGGLSLPDALPMPPAFFKAPISNSAASRFVVCVKDSAAATAAFQLTLTLCKPGDVIIVLHVIPSAQSQNQQAALALAERFRDFGYNLFTERIPPSLMGDNGEAEELARKAAAAGRPMSTRDKILLKRDSDRTRLARAVLQCASRFDPSFLVVGADAIDIACAMDCLQALSIDIADRELPTEMKADDANPGKGADGGSFFLTSDVGGGTEVEDKDTIEAQRAAEALVRSLEASSNRRRGRVSSAAAVPGLNGMGSAETSNIRRRRRVSGVAAAPAGFDDVGYRQADPIGDTARFQALSIEEAGSLEEEFAREIAAFAEACNIGSPKIPAVRRESELSASADQGQAAQESDSMTRRRSFLEALVAVATDPFELPVEDDAQSLGLKGFSLVLASSPPLHPALKGSDV